MGSACAWLDGWRFATAALVVALAALSIMSLAVMIVDAQRSRRPKWQRPVRATRKGRSLFMKLRRRDFVLARRAEWVSAWGGH